VVFLDVLENQPQRIGEEWSWFGGAREPLELLGLLERLDPVLALREFEKVNPHLDLNKLKDSYGLQSEEMYDYAVGILSLIVSDP
jgi:hypothetical protein